MKLSKTLLLFCLCLPAQLWAQQTVEDSNRDEAAVQVETRITADYLRSIQFEDLAFTYDPEGLSNDPGQFGKYSKQELLQILQNELREKYKEPISKTEIQIPIGPRLNLDSVRSEQSIVEFYDGKRFSWIRKKIAGLSSEFSDDHIAKIMGQLQTLNEADLKNFLSKRHQYLVKTQHFFQSLRKLKINIPIAWQNRILVQLNNFFYGAPENIVHSNSSGINVMFHVNSGFSFGRILARHLNETPLARFAGEKKGFYYLLGAGFGFAVSQHPKRKVTSLDLVIDFQKFKSATTPLIQLGATTFSFGFLKTLRKDEVISIAKYTDYNIPLLGNVRQSPEFYMVQLGGLPTGIPLSWAIKAEASGTRLTLGLPIYWKKTNLCRSSL